MNEETEATPGGAEERFEAPERLVDRYEIGPMLGRGGVGQVHRAHDTRTGLDVAIKFVRPTRHFAVRQVRRELTALRALALPGVVRLLDDGMSQGQYFLVMSLVEGVRLDDALNERDWNRGAPLIRSLLATLGRVHLAGIVRRDLKPANIRITPDGRPVLLDFGLAWGGAVARVGGSTREGSPGFAAPEQWRGEPGDARTDLYALGRVLRDWVRTCGAPETLQRMVAQMLAESPEDRPHSALEVLEAFGGERASVHGRLPDLPDPATPQDLRQLFGGPRRSFFHLDSDAAALLYAQTRGDRTQVEATLSAWVDRGDARWNGRHFEVDRGTLDRLVQLQDGNLGLLKEPARMRARAQAARKAGRLAQAWAMLEPSALMVREDETAEAQVLTELVVLALEMEHLPAIEAALHLCERAELLDFLREDCVRLLQGARAAIRGEGDRARLLLDALWFEAPALERMRCGYRALMAGSLAVEQHATVLEQIAADGASDANLAGWRGTLVYRQGDWIGAAELHEKALNHKHLPQFRLASRINASQAWLEALNFARALDHAKCAIQESRALRHPDYEARATWVQRTALYRQGHTKHVRIDLVDAAFDVSDRRGALHAMTEAAIGWRLNHPGTPELAARAAAGFRSSGVNAGALLADALKAASRNETCDRPQATLTQALAVGVPEITLQILALWPGLELDRQTAHTLAQDRPQDEWQVRLDVLSIHEALDRLDALD